MPAKPHDLPTFWSVYGASALAALCQTCVSHVRRVDAVHALIAALQPVLVPAKGNVSDSDQERVDRFWDLLIHAVGGHTSVLPRLMHAVAVLVLMGVPHRHATATTPDADAVATPILSSDNARGLSGSNAVAVTVENDVATNTTQMRVETLLRTVGCYATAPLLQALATVYADCVSKTEPTAGDGTLGTTAGCQATTVRLLWALLFLGADAARVRRGQDVYVCFSQDSSSGRDAGSVFSVLCRPAPTEVLERARFRFLRQYVDEVLRKSSAGAETDPTADPQAALVRNRLCVF